MENTNENKLYQVAEIQLIYKSIIKPSLRPKINTYRDARNVFMKSWDDTKLEFVEQFKAMLTNRANKVLGIFGMSTGGVSGTVADPKIIFAVAIQGVATGIILALNIFAWINFCTHQMTHQVFLIDCKSAIKID